MNTNKIIYTKNFNKSASTYDLVANIQQKCALELVNNINNKFPYFYPKKIIDVGCGTGFVSEKLLEHYPKATYILNDISNNMLEIAKNKFQEKNKLLSKNIDLHCQCIDAEKISGKNFDLVASNFTFHWFNDPCSTIERLFKQSNILAFTILLDNTFKSWYQFCKKLNINYPTINYPNENILKNICLDLKPKDYHFKKKTYNIKFNSIISLIRYIKKLGAQGNCNNNVNVLTNIIKKPLQPLTINYEVMYVFLENPNYSTYNCSIQKKQ